MRRRLTLITGAVMFAVCVALIIYGGSLLVGHILTTTTVGKH